MQIDERAVGEITVLDLKGNIVLNEGDVVLRDKINSLIQQGKIKLILNLAAVPYVDSAGLGELVRAFSTVRRHGGNLKMVHLTKRITDLLTITKLLMVFDTFESEKEALDSFA
jgi:anti-sigma B factor antagonist